MHVALPTRSRAELTSALGASKTRQTISSLPTLSKLDVSLPTFQRSSTTSIAISSRLRNDRTVSKKSALISVLGEQPRAEVESSNRRQYEPSIRQPTRESRPAQVIPVKANALDYVPDSNVQERHPTIVMDHQKEGTALHRTLKSDPYLIMNILIPPPPPPPPKEDMIVWQSGVAHLLNYAAVVKAVGGFHVGDASRSDSLTFRSFPPNMCIMSKFLSIMDALGEAKLDLVSALRRLYVLFRSHPQVWLGFNMFLHGGYRLTDHGCIFPDGNYVQMVPDEKKGREDQALSLKDSIPDNVSIRKAICLSDMMIGTLFMKLTISEDRTGHNGSEAKARLCALLDDSGVSTGRHLRIVSPVNRKGR